MKDIIAAEFCIRRAWNLRWTSRDDSVDRAQKCLHLAKTLPPANSIEIEGLAYRTLAWQSKWRGQFEDCENLCRRALSRLRLGKKRAAAADVYSLLGVLCYSRGRQDLAKENITLGYQMLEIEDNVSARIDLLSTDSTVLRYAKRYEDCQRLLEKALYLAVGVEKARVYQNIARSLDHLGNLTEALDNATLSVTLARQFGNRVILPYSLEVLGTVLRNLGRLDEAIVHLTEGEEIGLADQDLRVTCQILQQRAIIEEDMGHEADAFDAAKRGLEAARSIGYSLWEKKFLRHLAEMSERQGYTGDALVAWKQLFALEASETH
jgi:tetratricopeptide (TPR) repeat protein